MSTTAHRAKTAGLAATAGAVVLTGDSAAPNVNTSVLVRLAALKRMTTPQLKDQWRMLFDAEPPTVNRPYLESRLAYRIQELAYGGLKPETVRRLETMGEQLDGGKKSVRQLRADKGPVAGTRLVREWKGLEYTVTVLPEGFEWQGRPYKSLSAIARAITGTRWNGPLFFGLKGRGGA
jgi:hypothetical protein